MDHKVLVRPFLLGCQSPAFLVTDLDLRSFSLVGDRVTDGFRCFRVALCRMLPIYAFIIGIIDNRSALCIHADIAVSVTARVAFRDLPVGLLDLVLGTDDQVTHLDSVAGRNLGNRTVYRCRKCPRALVIFTQGLKFVKCSDTERYKFFVYFIPFTILGIRSRSFDIVSVHICREEIFLIRELIAQIESERKLSFELCSLRIGKEMSFRIVKHLLKRHCTHDIRGYLVGILYSRASLGCIVSDAKIGPRRPFICCSLCRQDLFSAIRIQLPPVFIIIGFSEDLIPALNAVYVDMLVYRSVYAAFNEFVAESILREIDHCCFTGSEQEYMVVCYSSNLHGTPVWNQFFGPLINCIYLSGQIGVRRQLFQKDRFFITGYYTIAIRIERVCTVLILLVFNSLIPDLIRILYQFV